jgi:dTDP-4-amino-4,6-dideoxygalactose transaminase
MESAWVGDGTRREAECFAPSRSGGIGDCRDAALRPCQHSPALVTATIPFANLPREVEALRPELDAAIARVLDRGWFVLGEEGERFEREFAAWLGGSHAVGVASGTDAVELALRALGIGAGDEVITQANTCVPTVAAIERCGAQPVLCDVEPEGATMDPQSLEAAITPRTAAIVAVHLYGQCADMAAIGAIADRRGIALVEDCAQAIGAAFEGAAAGTIGTLGCFSFYPSKNLAALGDAGAVVTGDPQLADRLRQLRNYGQRERGVYATAGINSRMDELQAAVLAVKLPSLERRNARRREIAAIYSEALEGSGAAPLKGFADRVHAFHQFVVGVGERDRFRELMSERGVATMIHYPVPVHLHEPYRRLAADVSLEVSEGLAQRIVSLPVYPELDDGEVATVAAAARECALAVG